jgi:drug/metabolite transporter (DMT)-like permease
VTRSYAPLLLTLAAVWGASYLFIKVAVDEIEPAALMAARMLIAAALLVPFLFAWSGASTAFSDLRAAWRAGLVLGLLNGAVPFTLVAWGEKYIDSGVAAIANATVPIFVALLAIRYKPSERSTGLRLVGIGVGFAGVAVLAGGQPNAGRWAIAGTLAVVLAAFSFGVGGLYGQLRVTNTAGPVLAAASMIAGAIVLLPFGIATMPDQLPGWKPIASLLVLSIVGTAFAQLVLFRMLRLHGASKTSLVTYLLPVFAVGYGATLLDEQIRIGVVAGLALVLAGVALGSGTVRLPRRVGAPVTPGP